MTERSVLPITRLPRERRFANRSLCSNSPQASYRHPALHAFTQDNPMTQFIDNAPDSETADQCTRTRREETDRQAIERAEDDGMIVNQTPTSGVDNRGISSATAER